MKAISTDKAPRAIGPYSQAVRAGDLLFVSGQIPIDPATGELVTGDIAAQTTRVLGNLEAILDAAEMTTDNVARCDVFLADMNDFAAVNEVYGAYLSDAPPARATVEVSRLPMDVKVEIDAIGLCG